MSAQALEKHTERAALVVCGLCFAGLGIATANLVLVLVRKETLSIAIPPILQPFVKLVAASAVGWLIGTTIFV